MELKIGKENEVIKYIMGVKEGGTHTNTFPFYASRVQINSKLQEAESFPILLLHSSNRLVRPLTQPQSTMNGKTGCFI